MIEKKKTGLFFPITKAISQIFGVTQNRPYTHNIFYPSDKFCNMVKHSNTQIPLALYSTKFVY